MEKNIQNVRQFDVCINDIDARAMFWYLHLRKFDFYMKVSF